VKGEKRRKKKGRRKKKKQKGTKRGALDCATGTSNRQKSPPPMLKVKVGAGSQKLNKTQTKRKVRGGV
jgi:hypothetical protein